ncbi:MAG: hypothetical protein LBT11_03235 [Treponema sp.]|jgi:hypothetical protein|nr:hypothetical protein [Treponema sp.]
MSPVLRHLRVPVLAGLCLFLLSQSGAAAQSLGGLSWAALVGTDTGLYRIDRFGMVSPLWTGGEVRKLLKTGDSWAMLTDQGIFISTDLRRWEDANRGLPEKTVKVYDEGEKSFISLVQEIKDLEVNPQDPGMLVCAVKDRVFLSRDGGCSWTSLGMPSYQTNGIKAVAAVYLPGPAGTAELAERAELTVFLSHSVYGIHYIQPDKPGAQWLELSAGMENLETTGNSDEVADIAVGISPEGGPLIYVSQTFRPRIYRLDWGNKRFVSIWSGGTAPGTVDSLSVGAGSLRFVREGAVMELPLDATEAARVRRDISYYLQPFTSGGEIPACMVIRENSYDPGSALINLSELWLLGGGEDATRGSMGDPGRTALAAGREGLYLPVNRALTGSSLKPYLDILENRRLNMMVIDMKDDYGRLRFTPQDPSLAEKGKVFQPIDIDTLLATLKERGIYAVARIVVFKDPELAGKQGGKYAVWDSRTNRPWQGYYDTRQPKGTGADPGSAYVTGILPSSDPAFEILRTYYDEQWVDPYSEEVWDYIAAVARELQERGFDEIQFDYIRFPTDGDNLANASYRWRDPGMDMESAILSFLRHVRSRVQAPISIDIYGANGWYRTGARTGQELELLSQYVDVICPMYYPSHFEQDFLAQAPAVDRPYRIYYQGAIRTGLIARGRVVVRPYAQAFYLNVSYDRRYYNLDYVRLQIEGLRDAGDPGYTYWNNSGRYDDIPLPDAIQSRSR